MTAIEASLAEALRDRYTIERQLGRGGMALVYLAHDRKHDRPVALKVMHPELSRSLGLERFLREIHTTARLQHPHILPVLDSDETGGFVWYTMPFVRGETLRQRLAAEIQLPVETAIDLASQIGFALEHAHHEGVVHRDLKPENILLSEGQALVADFGVAKAFQAGADDRLTEPGLAIGTPAYMSPEQASGSSVDVRTDIYSLGCILFEMLAGEPPFTGPTPQAVIAKRFADPVPSLRRVRPGVPQSIDRVVGRALAMVPADRFPSAAAFVEALHSAAVALSMDHAARRPSRGRRWTGVAAAALLAAAAAVLVWRSRDPPGPLDDDLVAVAPFDVLDPELDLWREGMVDLLARTFDGAGALRAVSPSTAVRRWRGPADPDAASRFARHLGARLAVFGTVLPAGHDSVRLRAAMLDAQRGSVVAEAEVPGRAADMGPLSDSLALRLLRGLGAERPVGVVRSASLTSRSVPALKAFLQGEQFYRAGRWQAAIEAYRRATELDTTFALAYFHHAAVIGWVENFGDTLSNSLFLRAGALNHGLAQRESLLVAAESIAAAATLESDHPGTWRRYRRQRDILETAVRRYPTDAEAWFMLADARYHYGLGPELANRPVDVAAALDRSLAADPSFGPAYPHRIELSLELEGPAAARRLIARYLALGPTATEAEAMRLVDALVDPARATSPDIERMMDTLSAEALLSASLAMGLSADSGESYLRILRALRRPRPSTTRVAAGERLQQYVSRGFGVRGHLREALNVQPPHDYSMVLAGQLGILPEDSIRTRMAGWQGPPFVFASWLLARRDTAGLRALVQAADSLAGLPGRGPEQHRSTTVNVQSTRAYLALARGDSAAALAALAAIPDTLLGPVALRLMQAQLLAAQGRERDAARLLDQSTWRNLISPSRVLIALERARLAERLGEPNRALDGYQQVVGLWRHADPELQPFVSEARAGLERLTAETRRR